MRSCFAISIALGLLAGAAQAEEKKDEDKLVCKRTEVGYTGTRVGRPKKTCMKQSEWRELEKGAEASVRKIQSGGTNPAADQGLSAR